MEMNRIDAAGSSVDLSIQKVSASKFNASGGKHGADFAKVEAEKLENELTAADRKLTEDFLHKMIDRANKHLSGTNKEFAYSIHENTGELFVKVIDRDTKGLIREIPPEKTLDAIARMWNMMGIFVDDKM